MAELTVFTAPKPFRDAHISVIQRNAIQSWMAWDGVEVILIGKDEGVAEIASEFELKHFPDVICNLSGTPLLSSIFSLAREHSESDILCYVNADILFPDNPVELARQVAKQASVYLIVGQRWDVDVKAPLDFSADWRASVNEMVKTIGKLHLPAGSDYFIFPKSCFVDIPDFAVGRAGWDNWMIFKARKEHWATVDATHDFMIIHQNHDYSHLPGGVIHYKLPETNKNIQLAGGKAVTRFTLLDADKCLVDGSLTRPKVTLKKIFRRMEAWPVVSLENPRLAQLFYFVFHPDKLFQRIFGR